MDQHISRLDTNTDDPGQQPNHGVGLNADGGTFHYYLPRFTHLN
jgi:hypothetical protein